MSAASVTSEVISGRIHKRLEFAACLFIGFMGWGTLQAFGTFYPYIIDHYGESRSKSSIVHSSLIGVSLIVGVVASVLIKKLGIAKTAFIGTVCLSGGFILSFFATKLAVLYITIGVIAGVGESFTYICSVVTTGILFNDKRQTFFLTIQNATTGAAGIILPYFFDWLVNSYGLNGAFLVLGGVYLNLIGCIILFYYSHTPNGNSGLTHERIKDEQGIINTKDNERISRTKDKILEVANKDEQGIPRTIAEHEITRTKIEKKILEKDEQRISRKGEEKRIEESIYEQRIVLTKDKQRLQAITDEQRFPTTNDEQRPETNQDRQRISTVQEGQTLETIKNTQEADNIKVSVTSVTYIMFMFSATIAMANLIGIFVVFMDVLKFKHISHSRSLVCLVALNVSSTLSRFLPVFVKQLSGIPMYTLLFASTCGLIGHVMLLLSTSFLSILIGSVFTGVTDGATMSGAAVVVFKLIHPKSQSFAYGVIFTGIGVLSSGAGPLYGAIYDLTDSYFFVLVITSSVNLLSMVFASGSIIMYKRLQKRNNADLA